MSNEDTATFELRDGRFVPTGTRAGGDLTDQLIQTDFWTDAMVEDAGIPIFDVPFVAVGGGMGSFVMVDYLRIAGVPADQITVLAQFDTPYHQYARLCRNSQIPVTERLRSDSASRPDNIWGFPSYAFHEAWREKTLRPLLNVFVEPILADYWTPRAGTVFEAMKREAERIGWSSMVSVGQARMVRRRAGGGYFAILTPTSGTGRTTRMAYRCRFVHVGVGYPALRYLEDLQQYRERHNDYVRVVNAYEPHEHVYEELKRKPGVVMVRGAGIVASRIIQRLVDDRDAHQASTVVVHLFRTYRDRPYGDRRFGLGKRPAEEGWAHQGFNITKASWGGQHRKKMLKLEGEDRAAFIHYIDGGGHTPHRKNWKEQIARGKEQGFYRQHIGEVSDVFPGPDRTDVVTRVRGPSGQTTDIRASFVIDCTGLESSPRDHRLLADLLDHGGAAPNAMGRLDTTRSFEVRGTAAPPGKLYASGAATAGGYYGGIDSFLGLQYQAQRIYEDMAKLGFGKRIGPLRSTAQWVKWMRGVAP